MNDLSLIPVAEHLPATLTREEMASTAAYLEAEKAPATRVAYDADWKDFAAWTAARGATALPAAPGVVGAYLSSLADAGLKASSIGRRCAAISDRHRKAGYDPSPTAHAGVKSVMKGIRRTIGTAPTKKAAATADIVLKMLAQCGDDLIGRRDRALIAVGMAGAFRRSELIALTMDDIETTKEGLLITIRRSKGDQEGAGQVVSLPHGHHIRPVEALTQWLDCAGIITGVIFRTVKLGGNLGGAMRGNCVARVVKKLISRAGLDRSVFSAHSLRSGFLSSAAEHGATIFKMQEQSRHKSLDVLSGYVRSKDRFKGHAGAGFL
jgi:site-specific recombinase XerD